ncbi:FAD:protein FMN transferase [Candidatus Methylospira mobilis]|uniref:FAD:protein FMN transferase n=1 Tax=Candidatus Methylospira mobilis TaxID=1808979 RepID=A0A5Q0BPZ7_9GAMM|nr:FAD:protein FMN transferase [Candidatus Methylospira mobilis]QFY44158.1 FAD:protein FMN transferase [Candidatus Methylospira mobilis]WNV06423.1 FAD:protein FMN transferase [Candidatus Methylospira mobilis]
MKTIVKPLLSALCLITLFACQPRSTENELSGATQGTTYHIKVVLPTSGNRQVTIESLRPLIEAVFSDIDIKLSNYRDDSEISRVNQQNTTQWITVSPEIVELVNIAQQVYERSDGCYDLTIKPLFDLWGFSKHQNRIPDDNEIKQTLLHVGMNRIEIDTANLRLRKKDPLLRIDLSSIAQGYTVDALSRLLEGQGIQNYLVEVGGEMKVKGRKANGNDWRVAIEKPTPYTQEVQRVLDIHQQAGTAIMTAGTYRNFFEDKGQSYSHILNPKTGRPVTHQLLSVTVLHDDPTWADAWDTALLCVGGEQARKIAESEHLKALMISRDGDALQEHMSSEFAHAEAQNR